MNYIKQISLPFPVKYWNWWIQVKPYTSPITHWHKITITKYTDCRPKLKIGLCRTKYLIGFSLNVYKTYYSFAIDTPLSWRK